MTKLAKGTRVSVTNIGHYHYNRTQKLEGVVVGSEEGSDMTLINFGAHFDGHNGFGRVPAAGLGPTCWFVTDRTITPLDAPIASKAEPKAAKQQTDRILNHLVAGKSITQLEAFGVYRIFRLAARIHELKQKGHKIVTKMRMDETGKPFAEYSLVTARRA